uniref:Uncharacterized protein n=1 Tax=Amphiprion percula TaxID=161767 RepID=A0A3P8S9R1_AMPPE
MSNLNKILGGGERVRKTTGQQAGILELTETEERLLKKREFLKEKIEQELLFTKKNTCWLNSGICNGKTLVKWKY